eukprot:1931097-Rhodomonas_salina.3
MSARGAVLHLELQNESSPSVRNTMTCLQPDVRSIFAASVSTSNPLFKPAMKLVVVCTPMPFTACLSFATLSMVARCSPDPSVSADSLNVTTDT